MDNGRPLPNGSCHLIEILRKAAQKRSPLVHIPFWFIAMLIIATDGIYKSDSIQITINAYIAMLILIEAQTYCLTFRLLA